MNTESTARSTVDTQLQTNIDAEAAARKTADTNLGNRITGETTARTNADTALQADIDQNMAYISTSLNKEILAIIDERAEKIGLTRGGYLRKILVQWYEKAEDTDVYYFSSSARRNCNCD